jgi:hypothetical protein
VDGTAGEFVGIGTVGDGIAAFGAVGGALEEAGGGVVGVCAQTKLVKAAALTMANAVAATVRCFTSASP